MMPIGQVEGTLIYKGLKDEPFSFRQYPCTSKWVIKLNSIDS
jgi:hypothetical protein